MERWIELAPWLLPLVLFVGVVAVIFALMLWWLKHPIKDEPPGDD